MDDLDPWTYGRDIAADVRHAARYTAAASGPDDAARLLMIIIARITDIAIDLGKHPEKFVEFDGDGVGDDMEIFEMIMIEANGPFYMGSQIADTAITAAAQAFDADDDRIECLRVMSHQIADASGIDPPDMPGR